MDIKKSIMKKNDCYKAGENIKPTGIVVHSTGANNPNLKRYVQPDDGILGVNPNKNDWNRAGTGKCVHAFIGKDKNGDVQVYQTLPWTMRCWGCGSGKYGTYNNTRIQFEICEDSLVDKDYFEAAFAAAADLCAFLCEKYDISPDAIVSHAESHKKGYASNHGDCDHWLRNFGKDMKWFRAEVKARMKPVQKDESYRVRVTAASLNVRNGAGVKYRINNVIKRGEVYTIVDEKNGWGKLKSGAGWINLSYTKRL